MIQKTTRSSPSMYFVWLGRCNVEADQHQATRAGGCLGVWPWVPLASLPSAELPGLSQTNRLGTRTLKFIYAASTPACPPAAAPVRPLRCHPDQRWGHF